jgi:ATP-dependent DNA helicase RecG
VIDEQHKFGVTQRAGAKRLGIDPHYLVMTATPIPRTLALTLFGDLDVSVLKQPPPGRLPVTTRWAPSGQRDAVWARWRDELARGRQGYVVCPVVDESKTDDVKSAVQAHTELGDGPLHGFGLGLLHGRMDESEKDSVMEAFRRHELDVLVCTTVVEVGVDVPNATLLVIEHADRFGVSQLHQLRGRVARGAVGGQCTVFAEPTTLEARERLRAFVRTADGFALAEEDARLRGGGKLFGTRQHGLGELRLADPIKDLDVLGQARQDAFALVAADAGLRRPEHAAMRQAVFERFGNTLDLAEIG